jgi:hypothetical protein
LSNNVRLLGRNTQVNKNGPTRDPFSFTGAPGRIRTCDLKVRNRALYPTELRALADSDSSKVTGLAA